MRPPVRRLVLAEKFSAARRLAQILSQGKTETVRAEGFSYFQFSRAGDHVIIFPLRGHVVEIDYPAEAHDWKDTDLDVLIDMEPIRHESPPALHDTLRRLAEGTDEVVLATDYDREGELIGVEALETLRGQRPDLPARRARFSAMSPSEVRRAFETLTEPDWALAQAAAARQRIDLAWGAVLTRFLTLECASDRQILSAGRVQTPTLGLVAEREREREDFVPRSFWNVRLVCGTPPFEATAVGGPFWDSGAAQAVVALSGLGGETASVERITQSEHREPPPAPFKTTSLPAKASAPPAECSRLRICTSMEKSAIRERTTRCIPLPFPSMKSLDGCANLPMAPTRRGCLPSPHWNPAEVPFRRRTIRRCTRPPLLRSGGTASGLGCTTWSRADSSRRSPPRA